MDFLEFGDVLQEIRGAMNQGRLKLTNQGIVFKNNKTGKVDQIQDHDVDTVHWQRFAGAFGLRIMLKNGQMHRFGGFKDTDQEKLTKFFQHTLSTDLKEKDLSLKGWNWGTARFTGSVLAFDVDRVTAFEIPLSSVSHCTTAKNEVTLEFHPNDDAAVSMMEVRFHIPPDPSVPNADHVEAFRSNVMSKASIIQATGESIATFKEVQCLTPRGRYDIKIFPSFIQLHGKTFDYKIPMTTVLRLFLLPHKDKRQMFFVVSLDPPIKQGQTRYHFLVLLFNNEEEITLEVGLTDEEIQERYDNKIAREMNGLTYEVLSKIMKVLVQRKITVPGNFVGNSDTSAVSCSYKAAAGFMYPLERGFIYVHKPPIHLRFEEVASVNFARSGGSTRSFDFEVETKSGVVHTFSSIEKEEYGKLYDFIMSKKLRIKNRGQMDGTSYTEELVDSDAEDEPDAYMARVKAEARERDDDDGDSEDDESDESFNPGESGSEVAEEYDSNASSSTSSDEGEEGGTPGEKSKHKAKEKKPKKAKTVPEERKPRKKKSEKDENRPKRPQSAYFLWLNESRERLKNKFPGISVTDLTKKAGEEWRELTDKKKWEKLADEAKNEYKEKIAEYKESGGSSAKSSSIAKRKKATQSPSQKSPTKSLGSFKSKEYISSSEGSSSDNEKGNKKKAKKEKKDSDKESEKSIKASKKNIKAETKVKKEKESEPDKEKEEEEEEEEEPIEDTPPTSEEESNAESD